MLPVGSHGAGPGLQAPIVPGTTKLWLTARWHNQRQTGHREGKKGRGEILQ